MVRPLRALRHLLALVFLLLTLVAPARAFAAPATIAPSEIKPGMKGYGLTVFVGTKPERFEVYAVGVLHNFLPAQDIILIRSDDARLKHSGIVAGMSGSPIYFDGKLAGAIAYGWSFAKDPIAGVTPIGNMLSEIQIPLRGVSPEPAPKPRAQAPSPTVTTPSLERAMVPVSVSGVSGDCLAELSEALRPYHLVPLAGGAPAPNPGAAPAIPFEAGGSISVQLIRGDVSAAATGTVTYVGDNKVLAFGHPMFNLGEVRFPVYTSEVHTFMAAMSSSFKMASPRVEVGALIQDRQPGVLADTSQRASMIPVDVTLDLPGRAQVKMHAEVIRHRFLTPILASTVISNAAQANASDVAESVLTVKTKLSLRGHAPIEVSDIFFSPDGISGRALIGSSGLKAITDVLFNPFAPLEPERIDVTIGVEYRPAVADIVALSTSADLVEPGSRTNLLVTLRPYAKAETTVPVALDIPADLAGQTIKLTVVPASSLRPESAPPETLIGFLDNLRKSYPARALIVTVETPDEGVALRGRLVPRLPDSVIDTLKQGASSRKVETYKRSLRIVVPTDIVVQGKQELTLRVRNPHLRD